MWIITCVANGERQLSAEVLGEAHGERYESEEEAQAVAHSLQQSIEEVGLPEDTEYFVEWTRCHTPGSPAGLTHEETTVSYDVTYIESVDLTESQVNGLVHLERADVDLETIRENCRAFQVDADLYDAQGFRRGRVHADGSYTLR
jgi:hypothetical protein